MDREHPEWQPLDPDAPASSPLFSSEEFDDGAARVVALVATPSVLADGWAARAALGVARECRERSGRVLLADLVLDDPTLHEAVDLDIQEGVSDVVLWGASLPRVAREIDRGILFASAGTVAPEPRAVYESGRWSSVIEGLRGAGVTFVLLAPEEADGVEELLERATDVVLLASADEAAAVSLGGSDLRLQAVHGPDTGAPPASSPSDEPPELPGGAEAPASAHAGEDTDSEGEPVASHDDFGPVEVRDAREDGPPARERDELAGLEPLPGAGGGGPTRMVLLVVLLVVLGLLAAAWAGVVEIPYLTPLLAGATEVRPAPSELRTVGAAASTDGSGAAPGTVEPRELAYSLALGSFEDGAVARLQARSLTQQRPELLFAVAPVRVDGVLFHRLLVGPATDSASVASLRRILAGLLASEDASAWVARRTPLAFRVGAFADLDEARTRVSDLLESGIHAYVLERPSGPGPAYRVLVGAYADPEEASAMAALLEERGITEAVLTRRVGRIPVPSTTE